jgi:hypothetical protein
MQTPPALKDIRRPRAGHHAPITGIVVVQAVTTASYDGSMKSIARNAINRVP